MNHDKDEFSPSEITQLLGMPPAASAPNHEDGFGRVALRALAAIEVLRERHRLRQELTALAESGALDRVLADAQLSRADLEPMLANHPDSGHLLDEMAARLHVGDRLHADRLTERDMWRVCTLCREQGACKHWLASGATEGYAAFCPNAETLDQLRHAKN